jgi:glycogen debranching enzyme
LYEKLGQIEKSKALMETIRDVFCLPDQGCFADSVWWSNGNLQRDPRFDSMGLALGVINGTIPPGMYSVLQKQFQLAESEFGYRNVTPAYQANRASAFRSVHGLNAFVRNGAVIRNRKDSYQNSAIWPFVEARVVAALRKMGISAEAQKASDRMLARNGMNEWYSPVDGAPHGSGGQLWTAAAIIAQSQTA